MPKQKSEAQIAKMQARSAARMEAQGRTKLTAEQAREATGVSRKQVRGYVPPINNTEKSQRASLRSEQKKERLDLIQQQVAQRK